MHLCMDTHEDSTVIHWKVGGGGGPGALPLVGSRGVVPDGSQGSKPPEAEGFF